MRIFDIFTGQAAQNAANAEIAGSRQSYGLLSRVQPNADTAKFSLFRPSFSQRVAARDAAAVVPFVALSSKQRRISSLSVATGAARHAALFGPSPGGFWPPPPTTENPQAVSAARKSVWPNILRYVVINTMLRSAAQALKRRHMPSPDAPDALTVTDGAVTVGFITESGAKHFAFDAAGTLIGEYKTRVEAVRAIPNLIKQASAILKRARCDAMTGAITRTAATSAPRASGLAATGAPKRRSSESLVQPLRSGSFRRGVDEKAGAIAPAPG